MRKLLIIGAGGHGKVVSEIAADIGSLVGSEMCIRDRS